jgi:hypothetical protein
MVIYPQEKAGFDKVFARIHIRNQNEQASFFANYQIKSQREKNAIVIQPKNIKSFIDDLKILVNLNYESNFKLTQVQKDNEVVKYIEISASQSGGRSDRDTIVRTYIEVNTIFSTNLYPDMVSDKEASFSFDTQQTNFLLNRFAQRFEAVGDKIANIGFKKTDQMDANNYQLMLSSEKMDL